MSKAGRFERPGLSLIPRRSVYLVGVLSGVKALGLVLLAESIARGVASLASGDPGWRNAIVWGVLAGLLRAAAGWSTSVVTARAAIGTKESLRARLAERLVSRPSRTGSMTTLATRGLDELDEYFVTVLPAMSSAAVIPLLIGVRILAADWLSALIVVLTVPLIPVFMILVGRFTEVRSDAAATALARLSDHIVELARGLPVLVGLGRMPEQAAALRRISDDYRRTTMATLRIAFLSSLVLELIATISVAVVAVTIGIRILGGGLGLETGLLVLILAPECYAPFRDLGAAFHASRTGRTALVRVSDVLDADAPAGIARTTGPLTVTGLTVGFDGQPRPVLDGISFSLPDAGITALLGASGSGKSTLLRALAGRLDDDAVASGAVQLVDERLVAFAPQHPRAVEDTVRAELGLYATGIPGEKGARIDALAARLGLRDVLDADPAQLSPGELRRLAVARALLRVDAGARLVLLDEPTAHLDDRSARAVVELIYRASAHASIVIASHDAAVTALASGTIQLGASGTARDRGAQSREYVLPDAVAREVEPNAAPVSARTALISFVQPALWRYVGAALLGTLAAAFAIALTLTSAWLIVRAAQHPAIMYLLVAIVGVRFFGLGRAGLRYAERLATHDAVFVSTTGLRQRLWLALAGRGATSRSVQRGGTALDYLVSATDNVRDLVPRVLVPAVVGALMSVGALVTSWLILPESVPVTAVVIAASLILAPMLALAADRASEVDRQRMRAGVLRRLAGLLEAADDLRSNGIDGIVRADLESTDQHIGRASRRTAASRGLGNVVVILAGCLGAMAMLLTVGSAVVSGQLIVEVGAVLVLLPVALIEPFAGAVAAIQQWPTLAAALVRTGELDGPSQSHSSGTVRLDTPVESLELDGVEATWPGSSYAAFSEASARVAPGQWLVVDGPSGSGKSTLLTVLLGSFAPTAGAVRVNGMDVTQLAPDELRRHVVWCPQDAHLFDSTVRANLLLGRARDDAPSEDELIEAMVTAGLGQVLASLPAGLDTRIGSEGSHLSGGERQRLAVARTLLSRAEIVLLDEPTAHLDESTSEQLMTDLRRAFEDRIVVLVTHHADELQAGDQSLSLGSRDRAPAQRH